MLYPEFFSMVILTTVLKALTDWITHLALRLVPSVAEDDRDSIACNEKQVNANAGSGNDNPLKKCFIPNTLETWPWPRRLNQHYPEVNAESSAWITNFRAFGPKGQEAFDRCHLGKTQCVIVRLTS